MIFVFFFHLTVNPLSFALKEVIDVAGSLLAAKAVVANDIDVIKINNTM